MQCSLDGYVSKNALGFRLRAALLYRSVLQGLDLLPSVFFGHDIMGWSGDGAILQGRYVARVELEATIMKNRKVGIAWQPTWGGAQQPARPWHRPGLGRLCFLSESWQRAGCAWLWTQAACGRALPYVALT